MNDKFSRLKRAIISQAIKSGIFVGISAAILAAAFYVYTDSQDQIKRLNDRDSQLKANIVEITNTNERSLEALELYTTLQKESKFKSLELDRKEISNLLNGLSEKYRALSVTIAIEPSEDRIDSPFEQENGTLITSKIKLDYDTISDAHSLAMLQELLREFSGYHVISQFSIKRTEEVSEGVLRALLKQGKASFMSSSLSFEWLGMRPNPVEETALEAPVE